MSELIPITEQNGEQAVSARVLYEFLEVKTEFVKWCERMFEYGFTEEQDFSPILTKSTGGRPSTDYALTLDCAKEIAMLQRTERGKQARQYFIEVEKRYRAAQPATLSTLDILEMSIRQMRAQEVRVAAVEAKVAEVEAKVTTINTDFYAVAGWAALHHKPVPLQKAQEYARKCRRLSLERGIVIGKTYDAKYGTVNTYHREILEQVMGN